MAYRYFFQAFPEAAVNFDITRAAALDRARAFVTAQGLRLDGYQSTIVFGVDDDQKTYLEREVGLERANRLMSSEVNVWYWDVRFFKPLQNEQFHVHVSPGGQIVGYEHLVEESAPGARLDRDAALARATDFLRDTLHLPMDNYTFLPEEASSEARPARTDWSFTWERTGFRVQDAPYRLRVELEGDRIGGYEEFLKVPEAWNRDFAAAALFEQFSGDGCGDSLRVADGRGAFGDGDAGEARRGGLEIGSGSRAFYRGALFRDGGQRLANYARWL